MGSEYSHMLINLLGVITLMLVCVFLIRKFKLAKYAGNKHIKIVNVMPIGAKEKVILLEVNNTTLLIGATPTHVSTLHIFGEAPKVKAVADEYTDELKSFSEHMIKAEKQTAV